MNDTINERFCEINNKQIIANLVEKIFVTTTMPNLKKKSFPIFFYGIVLETPFSREGFIKGLGAGEFQFTCKNRTKRR